MKAEVKRAAEKTLEALQLENKTADIYIISEAKSKELNRKYRGVDASASVLSFPETVGFPRPEEKEGQYLGEIFITPAYLKRRGYSVQLLIIHGILHLLGFDHKEKKKARRMEKEEKRIEKLIG